MKIRIGRKMDPARRQYPTWLMRVRAAGSDNPYQDVRIAARSAIQADAILKRRGVEVQLETARLVGESPDGILPVGSRRPLCCLDCGYHLEGLTVRDSIIDCPECGAPQLITAVNTDDALSIPSISGGAAFSGRTSAFMLGCMSGVIGLIALVVFLSAISY